jgi:hypothetical protein
VNEIRHVILAPIIIGFSGALAVLSQRPGMAGRDSASINSSACGPPISVRQGMVIVMVPDVRVTLGETACT